MWMKNVRTLSEPVRAIRRKEWKGRAGSRSDRVLTFYTNLDQRFRFWRLEPMDFISLDLRDFLNPHRFSPCRGSMVNQPSHYKTSKSSSHRPSLYEDHLVRQPFALFWSTNDRMRDGARPLHHQFAFARATSCTPGPVSSPLVRSTLRCGRRLAGPHPRAENTSEPG
jgi:hypothetical protein